MLAAKLRDADGRAEAAQSARQGEEAQAGELQAQLQSVRQAAADSENRHREVIQALKAELAELKASATPEKSRAATPEGARLTGREGYLLPPPPPSHPSFPRFGLHAQGFTL
jgi:hypothetical protein